MLEDYTINKIGIITVDNMKQIDIDIKRLPILVNICYDDNEEHTKTFVIRYDSKRDKVYMNKID